MKATKHRFWLCALLVCMVLSVFAGITAPPTGGTPATSMCLLTVNSAGRRFPDAGWPP